MVAAIIYYAHLEKSRACGLGLLMDLVLSCLVFFVLNPLFPGIDPFKKLI